MKQVELLEQLDEQGVRMLLNALPAWVKARHAASTLLFVLNVSTVFRL